MLAPCIVRALSSIPTLAYGLRPNALIACRLKSGQPYQIICQSAAVPMFQTPFYERVRALATELGATVKETDLAAGDHGTLDHSGWGFDIENEPGDAPRKVAMLLITPRPIRRHRGLARRRVAVRRRAILMMPKCSVHSQSDRRGGGLHDAARPRERCTSIRLRGASEDIGVLRKRLPSQPHSSRHD
jgi:hypothetical protein